jgi:hypothetical protein
MPGLICGRGANPAILYGSKVRVRFPSPAQSRDIRMPPGVEPPDPHGAVVAVGRAGCGLRGLRSAGATDRARGQEVDLRVAGGWPFQQWLSMSAELQVEEGRDVGARDLAGPLS